MSIYHKHYYTVNFKKVSNYYNKFIYYSTFNRSRDPVSRLKLVIFASKRNHVNFKKLKSWAENNRKIWNFVAKMKFRTKQKGRNLYVNSLNHFNNFCYMLGELFDKPESKPPLQYSRFGIQLPDRKKLGRRSYYYFSTTKHFNFSKWVNRKKTFFLPRISSKKIFFRLLTIFKQFFYKQDKELVRDKNDDIIDITRYLLGNNFFFNNKINKIISPSRLNPLLWKLYKKIAFSRLIWSKSTKFFIKKWFSQRVEKVIEKSKEKPEKLITTFQTIRYKHVHLRFGLRKFGKVKIPRKRRTKFSGKWQRVSYHVRRFVWHRWSRIVSLFLFRAFDYSSKIAKKYQTSTKKSISKYSLFKACCGSLKELTSQKLYLLKKRTKVLDTVFAAWIHNNLKNTRINNTKTLINLIFNNILKLYNLNNNIAFFHKELLYKNVMNINKNNLLYPLKKTIKYKNYFNYEMPIKITIIKNLLKIFLNHIRIIKEPITFKMIKDLTIDTALPTFASKAIKLFLKQHPEYIASRKKRIELHFGKLSFFNYIIQSILFNIYDWATSKDDIKLKLEIYNFSIIIHAFKILKNTKKYAFGNLLFNNLSKFKYKLFFQNFRLKMRSNINILHIIKNSYIKNIYTANNWDTWDNWDNNMIFIKYIQYNIILKIFRVKQFSAYSSNIGHKQWLKTNLSKFWLEQELEKFLKTNVSLYFVNAATAIMKSTRLKSAHLFLYVSKLYIKYAGLRTWHRRLMYCDVMWTLLISIKYYCSSFLADMIRDQLFLKKKKHWGLIKLVRRNINDLFYYSFVSPYIIHGLRVGIHGKINGRDRSIVHTFMKRTKESYETKLYWMDLKVDYSRLYIDHKVGTITIRVWISRI